MIPKLAVNEEKNRILTEHYIEFHQNLVIFWSIGSAVGL